MNSDREQNGRFILTGRHQPKLREGVAQSLAGRTSLVTLLPLSIAEIKESGVSLPDTDEFLLKGFMPELYRASARPPSVFYRDYLETYIEKDLRQMMLIKDLSRFAKFLKLLAGRVGQVVNMSGLAGETGVSSTTLAEWISLLEASWVIVRLHPYFSNISRQLVKSPKVYFTEPGLAAYLLGLEEPAQVSRDPLRGSLFENMVVVEALKARFNQNREPDLFYLRTAKGVEVDLILKSGGRLYPFEIKSAMTPAKEFTRALKQFRDAESASERPKVIYAGEAYPSFSGAEYINYVDSGRIFSA